jgi:hypothetical protein
MVLVAAKTLYICHLICKVMYSIFQTESLCGKEEVFSNLANTANVKNL